ncbi:aminotransferase class V-fold PLP-dependent enzyme [Salinibacterium hongtaonis]|uniref:Aminotransferase n=1 Tax=Homoserinimonas hongtaonis TaxID=2079791 RepID=A0A2U1T042_9MICO|nr:aminotransferase class V-fold PLP-dependent enzyme [Salinibacterium hongtaonis]PWB97226.1 aminotransferase [Salinibacterium hongtaonis]
MTTLDEFAADFGEDAGYLDFARLGPVSGAVLAEERMMGEFSFRSRFASIDLAEEHGERALGAVAEFTGFRADQVVFQPDTSTGLMHALFGLEGTIALSPLEYPSMRFAAARAERALGRLSTVWLEPEYGRIMPGTLREQLTDDVTAVAVSLVDHRTGFLTDLEGVRQVIGDRLLVVDAVQGVGVVDAPLEVADVVACGGQKWLRAGRGTGFLALSDRAVEQLDPVLSGWRGAPGTEVPEDVPEPPQEASSFSMAKPAPNAQARLAAAVEAVSAVGVDVISDAVSDALDRALSIVDEFGMTVVSPRNRSERAGIIVVEPQPDQLTLLAAAFYNHGVSVTTREGTVRLSVHVSTTDQTFGMLRESLAEFASTSTL